MYGTCRPSISHLTESGVGDNYGGTDRHGLPIMYSLYTLNERNYNE
jgi:hypothetical protein